jgi:uncharacterized protein YndB with AHSA1/START domain
MTRSFIRVETTIDIDCPADKVFNYVTTPALWSTWHPATVNVREAPDRPLTAGESVIEGIAVAGIRREARWSVLTCEAPSRWEIETETRSGAAHIVYVLTPTASGCRFRRTLDFCSKRWPWRLLDSSLLRLILMRQSAQALRNLKRVLER